MVNLSVYPWPPPEGLESGDSSDSGDTTTTPVVTPVTITAVQLAAEIGIPSDQIHRAERLLAVATERVNRYAPIAKSVMKDEAIIRFAGYLSGSDYGGVQSESIGPRSVTYTSPTFNASAFRSSGAEALLSPYKVRRAGSIKGS